MAPYSTLTRKKFVGEIGSQYVANSTIPASECEKIATLEFAVVDANVEWVTRNPQIKFHRAAKWSHFHAAIDLGGSRPLWAVEWMGCNHGLR
jgi:hypothetical protein